MKKKDNMLNIATLLKNPELNPHIAPNLRQLLSQPFYGSNDDLKIAKEKAIKSDLLILAHHMVDCKVQNMNYKEAQKFVERLDKL